VPTLLSVQNITKGFGGRPLFEGITLAFQDDERLGLIGPNGSGKSTLLRILAGLDTPDDGERVTAQGLKLGYVPQVDVFPAGASVLDVLQAAQTDDHTDAHEREVAAGVLARKMGFTDLTQKAETLSGGWKKRLAIARALVVEPALLLLDEPTNHLDLEGIVWLEEYLDAARIPFIVVTHDRYFLENVTRRIVELDRRYANGYFSVPGNYSEFLQRRDDFLTAEQAYQDTLGNKVRREIEWLRRGPKARTTKAKARIDEAGRLITELGEMRSRTGPAKNAEIDFTATERKTKELVVAKHVHRALGGRTLFKDLSVTLSAGMRLGLLGANGSGKSTLLRMLAGIDEPDAGTVKRATALKTVMFDQQRAQLNKAQLLRAALCPAGGDAVVFNGASLHVASYARKFLFRADQLDQPVGSLSGGEQARLLIAQLMLRPADLLLLDEPTNDLDLGTLEVLEDSLLDFPGAIVLVTHDRFMLDRVSTHLLGLDGAGGATLFADFAQWQNAQRELEKAARAKEAGEKPKTAAPAAPAAKAKKLTYNEQREWDGMEAAILAAETEVGRLTMVLHDPANASNGALLIEYTAKVAAAQAEVDRLYARWAELEAKIA
jgi:ATP-binding cassette subfamily F protein uup